MVEKETAMGESLIKNIANGMCGIRRVAVIPETPDGSDGPMKLLLQMTMVRLADGSLFLHSPIALDRDLEQALAALGPVALIVAPNVWHHLFLKDYFTTYLHAKIFAAPGLPEKRPDLPFHGTLSDEPVAPDEIEQIVMQGYVGNEVAFLHVPSRTLLLGDLACNVRAESPVWERNWFQRYEAYGEFALLNYHREFITEPTAARRSLRRILEWDFDRVVVGHGRILESGGKQAFERIWSWLL
jgi:hypothetical protein